jgi:hypothetical protein
MEHVGFDPDWGQLCPSEHEIVFVTTFDAKKACRALFSALSTNGDKRERA